MIPAEWRARGEAEAWPWPDTPSTTVHVCRADLDTGDLDRLEPLLSSAERARADRYVAALHRRRFVAARGYLREMLGGLLEQPPADVAIEIGPHGKPVLAHPHGPLEFNLSHSGHLALYAFSQDRPVGVDVERARADIPWNELADRFFAPEEAAGIAALPAARQLDAFFACWTRKEAVLKATGTGLSRPLRGVVVPVDPDGQPRTTVEAPATSSGGPSSGGWSSGGWSIVDLHPEPGHRAALAVQGPVQARLWTWASVHSRDDPGPEERRASGR